MAGAIKLFSTVPLTSLMRSNRRLVAICRECRAHQPVYLLALAVAHGERATLAKVGHLAPCFFCDATGMNLNELPSLH